MGEPDNDADSVHIDCDDIQVFILRVAWALPRRKPGVIEFTLLDMGWSKIELDQANKEGVTLAAGDRGSAAGVV